MSELYVIAYSCLSDRRLQVQQQQQLCYKTNTQLAVSTCVLWSPLLFMIILPTCQLTRTFILLAEKEWQLIVAVGVKF